MFATAQAKWHLETQGLQEQIEIVDAEVAAAVEKLKQRRPAVEMIKGVVQTLGRQFRPKPPAPAGVQPVPAAYQEPVGLLARLAEKLMCSLVLIGPVKAWRGWHAANNERVANKQLRGLIGDCHQRLTEQVVQLRREMPRSRMKANSLARSSQQATRNAERADRIIGEVAGPDFDATLDELSRRVSDLEGVSEKLERDCAALAAKVTVPAAAM
jgi:hypothetical protein